MNSGSDPARPVALASTSRACEELVAIILGPWEPVLVAWQWAHRHRVSPGGPSRRSGALRRASATCSTVAGWAGRHDERPAGPGSAGLLAIGIEPGSLDRADWWRRPTDFASSAPRDSCGRLLRPVIHPSAHQGDVWIGRRGRVTSSRQQQLGRDWSSSCPRRVRSVDRQHDDPEEREASGRCDDNTWISYYRPDIAAMIADWVWYVCPVPAAKRIIANRFDHPDVAQSPLVFPTADSLAPTGTLKHYRVFENDEAADAWTAIFGSRSSSGSDRGTQSGSNDATTSSICGCADVGSYSWGTTTRIAKLRAPPSTAITMNRTATPFSSVPVPEIETASKAATFRTCGGSTATPVHAAVNVRAIDCAATSMRGSDVTSKATRTPSLVLDSSVPVGTVHDRPAAGMAERVAPLGVLVADEVRPRGLGRRRRVGRRQVEERSSSVLLVSSRNATSPSNATTTTASTAIANLRSHRPTRCRCLIGFASHSNRWKYRQPSERRTRRRSRLGPRDASDPRCRRSRAPAPHVARAGADDLDVCGRTLPLLHCIDPRVRLVGDTPTAYRHRET